MTGEETASWGRRKKVRDEALSSFFPNSLGRMKPSLLFDWLTGQVGTQIYQISINHSS